MGPHEAPALQVEAKSPEVAEASHSAPGLRAGGLEMTPSFDLGLAWPGLAMGAEDFRAVDVRRTRPSEPIFRD